GASNFLLAAAPDESGALREADLAQLKILGNLVDAKARRDVEPGSWVTRVEDLGTISYGGSRTSCSIVTGSQPLRVKNIGRFHSFGNHENHTLRLADSNGRILAEAQVEMREGAADANGFQYAELAEPVTLSPHSFYELLSDENDDSIYVAPRMLADGNATL